MASSDTYSVLGTRDGVYYQNTSLKDKTLIQAVAHQFNTSNMDKKDLWTNQRTIKIKSEAFWAKLRVKHDEDKNPYYDVLVGEKHKGPHAHIGYALTGNDIFCKTRDQVTSLQREIKSQIRGKYPTENLVLKDSPGKCILKFSVTSKDSTKESVVEIFELKEV